MKRMIRFVCVPLVWFCFLLKQDLQTDGFIKRADFIYAWTGCPDTVKGIRYLAKTVRVADGVLHLATGK